MKELMNFENYEDELNLKEKRTLEQKIRALESKIKEVKEHVF